MKEGESQAHADRREDFAEMQRRRIELNRRWERSPWRIIPPPLFAYIITALFYIAIDIPDPWLRALGPVLAITSYLLIFPVMRRRWYRRNAQKDLQSREGGHPEIF